MPSELRHQSLNLWTLITFFSHLDIKSHEHQKITSSTLLSLVWHYLSCFSPADNHRPVSSLPPAMRRRSFSHINICTLCTYGSLSAGHKTAKIPALQKLTLICIFVCPRDGDKHAALSWWTLYKYFIQVKVLIGEHEWCGGDEPDEGGQYWSSRSPW